MSAQRRDGVDRRPQRGAVELGVRPVQVADDPLGVESGRRTRRGRSRGPCPAVTARPRAPARARRTNRRYPTTSSITSGPHTAPCPGTIVVAPSGLTTSSSTSMAPATEPCSRNGVPPLNSRSPAKSTRRSGSQTIESLVVCAGVPTWRTSHAQVVDPERHRVGVGEERRRQHDVAPVDLGPERPAEFGSPQSQACSARARSWPTIVADRRRGSCRRCGRRGGGC